ncbi:hypothetical protein [Vibrio breoganii]|uniref:hypothetical protein n=1 Tax=Vibrio breoganii TaxID=553239 RepID=UPI0012FFF41C
MWYRTEPNKLNKHSVPSRFIDFAINASGFKVFEEGEWQVKMDGIDGKRLVWCKSHLEV